MTAIFATLICLFFAQVASAATSQIFVQCTTEGPVLHGIAEFPSALQDWQIIDESKCLVKAANTRIKIEFNGVSYGGDIASAKLTGDFVGCKGAFERSGFKFLDVRSMKTDLKNQWNIFEPVIFEVSSDFKTIRPSKIGNCKIAAQ